MNRFSIPTEYLRTLQIIHLGIGIGVIPLLFIIILLMSTAVPSEDDYQLIMLLTQVHIVLFFVGFFASGFLQARLMIPPNTRLSTVGKDNLESDWINWLNVYKTAHVVALTVREGPALLGAVVLMIAAANGVLAANSYFWVNTFSSILFIVYVVLAFPTEEKIRMATRF